VGNSGHERPSGGEVAQGGGMNARECGVAIALAAILVQAPRLVLAVLAADRQAVDGEWQRGLLVVAGLGTALVLTGGNLYLAHTIASLRRWRAGLAVMWLVVLAASGGLVVPMIAAGISGRTLPQVLDSLQLAWAWSLLAALAHEVTAAGCMLAAAALTLEAAASEQKGEQARAIGELLAQRDAARRELAALRQEQREAPRREQQAAGGSGRSQQLATRRAAALAAAGTTAALPAAGPVAALAAAGPAAAPPAAEVAAAPPAAEVAAALPAAEVAAALPAVEMAAALPAAGATVPLLGTDGAASNAEERGIARAPGAAGGGALAGADARRAGQPAAGMAAADRWAAGAGGHAVGSRGAGDAAGQIACREGCGKQFGSALAEIGHLRHCPVRRERQRQDAAPAVG
jgi:hypothetical protein